MERISDEAARLEAFMSDPAVDDYICHYSTEGSRRSVLYSLRAVGKALLHADPALDLDTLDSDTVNRALAWMSRTGTPNTVNTRLCAIKGLARCLWLRERMDGRRYERIKGIRHVRGSRISHGRMLEDSEIVELFARCDRDKAGSGRRDAAIFALMLGCGLRRSEVAGLSSGSLHVEGESKPFIRIVGKGNKERDVYLPGFVLARLREWLHERGDFKGPVFTRILKSSDMTEEPLSGKAVYEICRKYGRKLGMKSWTPHDCRRTCASSLIAGGVDLVSVRDFLGHASVVTTQIYDRRSKDRLKAVADKLRMPA